MKETPHAISEAKMKSKNGRTNLAVDSKLSENHHTHEQRSHTNCECKTDTWEHKNKHITYQKLGKMIQTYKLKKTTQIRLQKNI